jgi:hypothetical protein
MINYSNKNKNKFSLVHMNIDLSTKNLPKIIPTAFQLKLNNQKMKSKVLFF